MRHLVIDKQRSERISNSLLLAIDITNRAKTFWPTNVCHLYTMYSKIYPSWRTNDVFESKYLKNQARYENAGNKLCWLFQKLFQMSKEYFLLPMPFKVCTNLENLYCIYRFLHAHDFFCVLLIILIQINRFY